MEFTYCFYQDLLEQIKLGGYHFCNYHNYSSVQNPCILRHDVDFDLQKARVFAELESEMGVKTTYFVLVNTNFYNIFSSQNRKLLEKIQSFGHEIGLHFDEAQYDIHGDWQILSRKVQEEAWMLSRFLEMPVSMVSMHRPSRNLLDANVEISGIVNSYQHLFFQEFKYFSDSRMYWRENVLAGIDQKKHEKLHILTHPFWYEKEEEKLTEKLSKFIESAREERYRWLELNFRDLHHEVSR